MMIQRVIVGSALAIATSALAPIVKQTFQPIARNVSNQVKYLFASTKEGVEDMIAEVKFERLKKQLDKGVLNEYDVEMEDRTEQIFY